MVKQMCLKHKGYNLASRRKEFEIVKSDDLEDCLHSGFPSLKTDTVVEKGLIDIAKDLSKAAKNIQDVESSLETDILAMYKLFDDTHPKDFLSNDFFLITGNL